MRVLGAVRADPGLAERLKNPCEWLMGFVRNVALQELRKQARRPRLRKRNQITICEYLFPEEDGWQVDRLVQRILDVAPQELTKRELEVITLAGGDRRSARGHDPGSSRCRGRGFRWRRGGQMAGIADRESRM